MLFKENIVKSEKAKLMRIKLTLQQFLNETAHYQMLRTILSESLHVGNSDISDEYGDMLDILPFLWQEQPFPSTYYPCTSIHLTIHMFLLERYHDIIESIQHCTPHMKKLFLTFALYGYSSHPFFCTELIQVVRKNLHLQLVELDFKDVKDDDDENTENADEQCRAWLERYCEQNQQLHMLDKPETIPLEVWLYVYHLASRGGANMLYRQLCQNAWYPLEGWHNNPPLPPSSSPKMQDNVYLTTNP